MNDKDEINMEISNKLIKMAITCLLGYMAVKVGLK